MNIIKTPTELIPVDEPAIEMTQAEYNRLSEDKKKNGTYYIIDSNNGLTLAKVSEIIGNSDISDIGDGTITGAIYKLNKIKFNNDGDVVTEYKLPIASSETLGGIKVGYTLNINDNGILNVNQDVLDNDDYELHPATITTLGGVKVGYGLKINSDGILSVDNTKIEYYELPTASSDTLGGVKIGNSIDILDDVINVKNIGNTDISSIGNGTITGSIAYINNKTNQLKYELPTASSSTLGGIKIGDGLSIDSDGKISVTIKQSDSYELPTASSSTLGGIKIGDGLSINNGVVSTEAKLSDISNINNSISDLSKSFSEYKSSSENDINELKQNIQDINSNSYELPTASSNTLGGIKVGSGLIISEDGTLSTSTIISSDGNIIYELPTASSDTLGGIKVGSTLSINGDGVLNIAESTISSITECTATTDTLGRIKVGDGLSISDDGTLSVNKTTSTITQDEEGYLEIA